MVEAPVAEAPVVSEKNGGEEPLKKKATPKKSGVVGAEPPKKAAAPVVTPVVVAKEPSPEPELEEEELEDDEHEEITYKGVEYYLKLDDQTVYDKASQEYVGTWNAETKSVEFEEEE